MRTYRAKIGDKTSSVAFSDLANALSYAEGWLETLPHGNGVVITVDSPAPCGNLVLIDEDCRVSCEREIGHGGNHGFTTQHDRRISWA